MTKEVVKKVSRYQSKRSHADFSDIGLDLFKPAPELCVVLGYLSDIRSLFGG